MLGKTTRVYSLRETILTTMMNQKSFKVTLVMYKVIRMIK